MIVFAVQTSATQPVDVSREPELGRAGGEYEQQRAQQFEQLWTERLRRTEDEKASIYAALQEQLAYNAEWQQAYSALQTAHLQLVGCAVLLSHTVLQILIDSYS